jgi:hypothetical protein
MSPARKDGHSRTPKYVKETKQSQEAKKLKMPSIFVAPKVKLIEMYPEFGTFSFGIFGQRPRPILAI